LDQDPNTAPPIQAPPTRAGPLGEGAIQRSALPTVIAILAIIFGVLGIASRLFSAIWMQVMPQFGAGDPEMEAMMASLEHWTVWSLLSTGIGIVLAAILLAGGIALARRRRVGVTILVTWAWVRMVFAMFETIIAVGMQREQLAAMRQSPGAVLPPGLDIGMLVGTAVVTIVLAIALPIVVLLVLKGRKAQEEIKTWTP
jgi:hypothetical protein